MTKTTQRNNAGAVLADQVIERYGTGDVGGQFGAFLAGMCLGYSGWSNSQQSDPSDYTSLLWTIADVCHANPRSDIGWPMAGSRNHGLSACVFTNDRDPVSRTSWADAWAGVLTTRALHYSVEGHVSLGSVSPIPSCSILVEEP